MPAKTRIDRLLVERGLFDSRAKAQAAIEAGLVKVNGKTIAKASEDVAADAAIEATPAHPYVSRGALKLVAALDHFKFDPKDRICLDVGASTGGFTQVLLERGAKRVYAVDVAPRNCTRACATMRVSSRSNKPTSASSAPRSIPNPI